MASCIFRDIFGVTRLWPPEFFWGYFRSDSVVASCIFSEYFWSDPVVASCIFRDMFGVTPLWPPVFFGLFME